MNAQATQAASKSKPARATKIAKSLREQVGKSTVADLESRATPASATAGVSPSLKTGASVNYSGQYLYDRFVFSSSGEDIAKMDIVRQMVKTLDFQTFKSNVAEMVSIAKTFDDREKSTFSAARLKTAQNHQSVMRNVYGALRLLPDQMKAAGVDDKTGYHVINTVAMRVLKDAGLKWDGSKVKSAEERAAMAHTKQEAKALAEVMDQYPKAHNESREAYFARIDKLVDKRMKEQAAEEHENVVSKLAERIKELAGDNLADVLKALAQ